MTIQSGWCGDNDRRSTKFQCYTSTDDGDEVAVYGEARATVLNDTLAWDGGDTVEVSHLTLGIDETFTFRVSRIGAAIESFAIYPERFREDAMAAISGGDLLIAVPGDRSVPFLYIEVNGIRREMLHVRFNGLDPTIPVGAITWDDWIDGGTPYIDTDQVVYVEPGIRTMPGAGPTTPPLLEIRNGGRLIILNGGVLIGNLKLDQPAAAMPTNIRLDGNGCMSSEFTTPEYTEGLSWPEREDFSFLRLQGAPYSSTGVAVTGITFINPCMWFTRGFAPNTVADCSFLNPWYWGIQGFEVTSDYVTGLASLDRCFALNHDDSIGYWPPTGGIRTDTDCYVVLAQGSPWLLGFHPLEDATGRSFTATRCGSLNLNDPDPLSTTVMQRFSCAITRLWMDGNLGEEAFDGTPPISFVDFNVDGPCQVIYVALENQLDPWSPQDGVGQIQNVTFSNVRISQATTNPHLPIWIQGLDGTSTPHDITFTQFDIAGTPLTEQNKNTFVQSNSYPHDITYDSGVVLASIAVTPAEPDTLQIADTQQLVATGTYSDASTADITELVEWSSDAPDVATVSNAPGSKGLVVGLAEGTATISAFYAADPDILDSVEITVEGEIAPGDIPFVVEDGTGLDDANSYCTVEFADAYHLQYGNPSAWSALTDAEKQDLLREATRAADERYGLRWLGYQLLTSQALGWPREFVYDVRGEAIEGVPSAVARWTARAALMIEQGNELFPTSGSSGEIQSETKTLPGGFSRSVTYTSSQSSAPQYPALDRMIEVAGIINAGGAWGYADA